MPGSVTLDARGSPAWPSSFTATFCRTQHLPDPAPPVTKMWLRQFSAPHTGAIAHQPANSIAEIGLSQENIRHRSIRPLADLELIGSALANLIFGPTS